MVVEVTSAAREWRSGLRYCATRRKVAGSTPDVAFFIDIILLAALWPSGRLSL